MSGAILAALSKVGNLVAQKIRSKADSMKVPKVSSSTYVGQAKIDKQSKDGAQAHISITIDTDKDKGAPAARAYEWGSGIHAEQGPKKRITIPDPYTPSKLLSFPKEDWPQYDPNYYSPPRPQPDWHHYVSVSHPGVQKRPYIKPSIEATKAEVLKILGQAVKVELLVGTKKVEEITLK